MTNEELHRNELFSTQYMRMQFILSKWLLISAIRTLLNQNWTKKYIKHFAAANSELFTTTAYKFFYSELPLFFIQNADDYSRFEFSFWPTASYKTKTKSYWVRVSSFYTQLCVNHKIYKHKTVRSITKFSKTLKMITQF